MRFGVQRLVPQQRMVLPQGTSASIEMLKPSNGNTTRTTSTARSGGTRWYRNGCACCSRGLERKWTLSSLLTNASIASGTGNFYSVPDSRFFASGDQLHRAQIRRAHEHALQFIHPSRMHSEFSKLLLHAGGHLACRSAIMQMHNIQSLSWRSSHELHGQAPECPLLKARGSIVQCLHADPSLPELSRSPTNVAQEFDYVVVVDFEATCDKNLQNFKPQEIIEFPSVLINCHCLSVEGTFQTYVKPVHHPSLTDFCIKLTGIQQEQIDEGVELVEALKRHDKWLEERGVKNKKFAILIWSDWDCKVMLESECKLKGLEKPIYFNSWINLKLLFQSVFMGRKCNLRKAVELAGLRWTGRAHCGLDDAINTARLALDLMRRGVVLAETGFLEVALDKDPVIFVAKLRKPEFPSPMYVNSSSDNLQHPNGMMTGLVKAEANISVCYCGVQCERQIARDPGPMYGKFFLGCGKWNVTEGNRCNFFQWVL